MQRLWVPADFVVLLRSPNAPFRSVAVLLNAVAGDGEVADLPRHLGGVVMAQTVAIELLERGEGGNRIFAVRQRPAQP